MLYADRLWPSQPGPFQIAGLTGQPSWQNDRKADLLIGGADDLDWDGAGLGHTRASVTIIGRAQRHERRPITILNIRNMGR